MKTIQRQRGESLVDMKKLGQRIKTFRCSLKLTQTDLGNYLGVSYQQVQRYEWGKDRPSINTVVNLAKLFKVSVDYLLFGEIGQNDEGKYLINTLPSLRKIGVRVSLEKLIQMVLFFASTCRLNKTKLNKLLFYADFLHFKEHGKAISHIPYVKLPYGPAPESYNAILGILEDSKVIGIQGVVLNGERGVIEERIEAKQPLKTNLFSDSELAVIKKVAFQLGDKTGAELSEISHQEPFFSEIEVGDQIPYDLAKSIKVDCSH